MAAIAYATAGKLHFTDVENKTKVTAAAGAAITIGQPINLTSSGTWQLADANASGKFTNVFIAMDTVASGATLTGVKTAIVDGFDLSSLAYNAEVFLSDTVGELADAAGTNSLLVGKVVVARGVTPGQSAQKVLQVNLPL